MAPRPPPCRKPLPSPRGAARPTPRRPEPTPLDRSFPEDTRFAADLGYLFPLSSNGHLGVGLSGSKEYDFTSVGANAHYTLDLNQKNTTLSAGAAFEYDSSDPVGGIPLPLTMMVNAVKAGGSSKSKNVKDILLGVTQVLGPRGLLQFNYSLSLSSGYQTDPLQDPVGGGQQRRAAVLRLRETS